MDELKERIQQYLSEAKMMQLATASKDGKPWVCNVWFAADDQMNLYWISSTDRRHSRELAANNHVAISICLVRDPSESEKGALQIEGTAEKLTNASEIARALKLYVSRGIFSLSQVKSFMADMVHPHVFYRAKPTTITLFQDGKKEYTLHA